MKKALTVIGAALVLGTSRKPAYIQPCSNEVKVVYFLKGKRVHIDTFEIMGSNFNGRAMNINCFKHQIPVTYSADSTVTSMK